MDKKDKIKLIKNMEKGATTIENRIKELKILAERIYTTQNKKGNKKCSCGEILVYCPKANTHGKSEYACVVCHDLIKRGLI